MEGGAISGKIRVISWNMGYWQHQRQHEAAWEYLRTVEHPDMALLQETRRPPLVQAEHLVFQEVHGGWGTAIYLRGGAIMRRVAVSQYPGRVAAAEVNIRSHKSLLVASVHAPIINERVFPHLDSIFSDIEAAFSGKPSLIGGDFNSARLAEQVWPGYGHGPFFERVDASWFVDIRKQFYEDELQTIYRPHQIHAFQDDHIFVSHDLANRVVSYKVALNEVTRKVSDHIPVVIEIEV